MSKRVLGAVLGLLLPWAAQAETPPEGVPLQVRRGLFAETDIGAFFTLGGENVYSNAQTYVQLGVGYDVSEQLVVGAHLGLGASAANCFAGYVPGTQECRLTDNFSLAFVNVTVAWRVRLAERLYLAPLAAVGYTRLDPAPVGEGDPSRALSAPNAGLGVGVEYATSLEHFSVGAELLARYVIGPSIPTFAFFPRVKYTF